MLPFGYSIYIASLRLQQIAGGSVGSAEQVIGDDHAFTSLIAKFRAIIY